MADDPFLDQGQHLREQLRGEREQAGPHRWQCSPELRSRLIAYAAACRADGESHQRVSERLGIVQTTLSRWMRTARASAPGLRQVAIVPTSRSRSTPAPRLRLLSPNGYVVEGVDPELLAYLLRVLG